MNGRAYDYNLGRFLSVDPFIQAPGNSQSMNPYSYIMNNPLAGTDPSGYFWLSKGGLEKPTEGMCMTACQQAQILAGFTNGGDKVGTYADEAVTKRDVAAIGGQEQLAAYDWLQKEKSRKIEYKFSLTEGIYGIFNTVEIGSGDLFIDVSEERAKLDPAKLAKAERTVELYHELSTTENVFAGREDSLQEARIAAANKFAPLGDYTYRELGWVIVELKSGKFAYTFPYAVKPGQLNGRIVAASYVEGWSLVFKALEGWHNHWDNNTAHSGRDGYWIVHELNNKVPMGLVDTNGRPSLMRHRSLDTHKDRHGNYKMPMNILKSKQEELEFRVDMDY